MDEHLAGTAGPRKRGYHWLFCMLIDSILKVDGIFWTQIYVPKEKCLYDNIFHEHLDRCIWTEFVAGSCASFFNHQCFCNLHCCFLWRTWLYVLKWIMQSATCITTHFQFRSLIKSMLLQYTLLQHSHCSKLMTTQFVWCIHFLQSITFWCKWSHSKHKH